MAYYNVDLDKNPDLKDVKKEETNALLNDATMWDDRIFESNEIYNDAIKEIGEQDAKGNWTEGSWADRQTDIANENLDFALDKIEQQRAQAKKDYIKEQSGAYVDWQKQSNQYGANAERMASMGMTGTGYSESSQVSMYNTYQNRVATAREVFARANLDYDNAMREAQLQNNSTLAEIAYQAYQDRLKLTLEGFQAKNTLLIQKAESQRAIRSEYFTRWKAVLDQINAENAIKQKEEQFNKEMDFAREKWETEMAFEREKFDWTKAQAGDSGGSGGSGTINKGSKGDSITGGNKTQKIIKALENNAAVTANSNVPIDLQSVLSLGYGPIGAEKLAELVASGEVIEYIEGGKRKFKKPPVLPFALQ